MRQYVIQFALFLAAASLFAQKNEWLDPKVNEINRAPMHANYFAYETEDAALKGVKEKLFEFYDIERNMEIQLGEKCGCTSTDFYRLDYNDKGWDKMPVPDSGNLTGLVILFT
jgi:beta-galactosidase